MLSNKDIVGTESMKGYLTKSIAKAVADHKVPVSEFTQNYLVSMLSRFIRSENIFTRKALDYEVQLESITLRYLQNDSNHFELQKLADECLFLTGFFYDFIEKEGISNVNFHCNIGSSAYENLSSRVKHTGDLYQELANNFRDLSDVIWDLRLQQGYTDSQLASLYLKCENKPDKRYSAVLIANGIFPPKKTES